MLAGILVLILIIDTFLTAWTMARYLTIRKEVHRLRDGIQGMCKTKAEMKENVPAIGPNVIPMSLDDAQKVLENASPDELAAALDVLRRLGNDA